MVICEVIFRTTATSKQLKQAADRVRRWRDAEMGAGECYPQVDKQALKDLSAGVHPQSLLLRWSQFLEIRKKVHRILGHEQERCQPGDLEQEPGSGAPSRILTISIECSPGSDPADAVARLRAALPQDLIEKFDTFRCRTNEKGEPEIETSD